MTRYICFEGTEGVGKSTHTELLTEYLRDKGYSVLMTKEPGTSLSPLTMELRNIMLNMRYENEITPLAREFISQAIRSIHLEKVIYPAMNKYDFIIQDRGILSGLCYAEACGHDIEWLEDMTCDVVGSNYDPYMLYDDIIYLKGNTDTCLQKALDVKKEFAKGDAMEARGNEFMRKVALNMDDMSMWFQARVVEVKPTIDQTFLDILIALNMENLNECQENDQEKDQ